MVKKQLILETAQDLRRLADKVESLAEVIEEEQSVKNEDKHKDSKEDVGVSIEGVSIEGVSIEGSLSGKPSKEKISIEKPSEEKSSKEKQPIEKSSEEEHLVSDKDSSRNQKSGKKITGDDITKIIVAKIKKDRNSQESIGKLLAGYGVDHISKIPEEKYEAFIKDLSEI